MKDEMIDRVLASEEALLPSSGFTAAVMERIREETAAPQPIPFPWRRVMPGIVLGCGGLGWGAVELTRLAIAAAHDPQTITVPLSASALQPFESLGWSAVALVVAFATWFVSQRIGGESQLL
jgi:hypothetical protein